ncbi:hypothetical protein [Spirosoma utsteinense]|uniref:Uncharacterized protein n=1 Tax=Spirosoma utsteinense TaxID=2585773 RepID=A0ABR6W9Y3_9BACT|nr:hypothetical protein [Spirosoma utsteinense]MBC3787047.1 hypothetical protein [Spirosoma utsteinense]MBC3793372.1 hypothetical protein [Spirosoma utsteinense]
MPEIPIDLPQGGDPLVAQTCQSQHLYWITLISRNEAEAGQLLLWLTNLPKKQNLSRLSHEAILYYSHLKRIETNCQRLRLNMVCERSSCTPTDRTFCCKPNTGLYTSMAITAELHRLSDELNQVKAGCQQFHHL